MRLTNKAALWPATAAVIALAVLSASPARGEAPNALCYLEGFEPKMEEEPMHHGVTMEVRCAHTDRRVVDVAALDLRFLDGDEDLLAAGAAWLEERVQEDPNSRFYSSEVTNGIAVSETGRQRTIKLRAHSSALPASGVARLEGSVDLVVEMDCVGDGAVAPLSVETTAGALRSGAAIPLAAGGEMVATEQGFSNESPMLALGGAAAYVALVEPPAGVREEVFFGKKLLVLGTDVAGDVPVTLRVCPTEKIPVSVTIEAGF